MKFYKCFCERCNQQTLFLEKLINPQDPNCSEIENICQVCNNNFSEKEKNNSKIKLEI